MRRTHAVAGTRDAPDPVSDADPGAECGREVTQNTTLDRDLVCGRGPAFVVAADGVTLDLGGRTVSCSAPAGSRGPGILLKGVSRATVRNGTVERFDAGVVVEGGGANVVESVTVRDNVGSPDGDFGDGIVVTDSRENRIEANTVERNGPYSGISLGPQAQGNVVRGNAVTDNNMLGSADPGLGRQTMGIRIEGPAANRNTIAGNTVTGSGGDGISVLATCEDFNREPPCAGTPPNEHNEVTGNTSNGNGTSGQGAGIRLFSMADPVAPVSNTIRDNVADGNASYGIGVDDPGPGSPGNTVVGNRAHDNREFDGSDGALMPPCGKNVWQANDFGTVNQPCVSPPGTAPPGTGS